MADAQNYAKTNPTAYIGQVLSVVVDGLPPRTPSRMPPVISPAGAAVDIATDSEVSEMLSEVFSTDNA